jgi:hypothetical protein
MPDPFVPPYYGGMDDGEVPRVAVIGKAHLDPLEHRIGLEQGQATAHCDGGSVRDEARGLGRRADLGGHIRLLPVRGRMRDPGSTGVTCRAYGASTFPSVPDTGHECPGHTMAYPAMRIIVPHI